MPTNWDDLLNPYDTRFNPNYQQQAPDPFGTQPNRFSTMPVPEWNPEPMRRYTDYLGSEPTRDQYRPGKFATVLNSLAGGFESMQSGSIGRGVQLYEGLRDRDFANAYETWKSRGQKYKAEADMEEGRYRNVMSAYDKMRDNERAERGLEIQDKNADTASKRLELEARKWESGGWTLRPSGDGTYAAMRVNPQTGQAETQETGIKTNELTPDQRLNMAEEDRAAADLRNRRTVGASIRNTDRTIDFRRQEGQADREFSRWRHTTPSASMSKPKETVATPTNTRTPVGLVENGYPQFNNPDLIKFEGSDLKYQTDPAKVRTRLQELSKKTGKPYEQLENEWMEFVTRVESFPKRPVRR